MSLLSKEKLDAIWRDGLVQQPQARTAGPWMPEARPDPEFDRFYDEQKQAGMQFPQIMDQWKAQQPPPNAQKTAVSNALIGEDSGLRGQKRGKPFLGGSFLPPGLGGMFGGAGSGLGGIAGGFLRRWKGTPFKGF